MRAVTPDGLLVLPASAPRQEWLAERRARREESGKPGSLRDTPREALSRRLREIEPRPIKALEGEGEEFALVVVRRMADGQVLLVGEVADDVPLLERAVKALAA